MQYLSIYESPVGELTLASDGENVTGLWMKGQKYFGSTLESRREMRNELRIFKETEQWLDAYFRGENPEIQKLPLKPFGSRFRQEVWKILCGIPYGTVTTYGEIAKEVAKRKGEKSMSAQAVGGAVGHNPISIIIPCHRVVGADGSLTGYAGGIDKKIQLLKLEGVDLSSFCIPGKGTALSCFRNKKEKEKLCSVK